MLGKPLHTTIALLLTLALATAAVPTQAETASPARSASAPTAAPRTGINPPLPTGTVDPDPQATPQLSIPLRKTAGTPPSVGAKRAGGKSTGGSIDDETARCQAQPSAAERAECLEAARKGAPQR